MVAVRGGSCFSRLASQRAEEFAKREEQRVAAEKAMLSECTFSPQINAKRPESQRARPAMARLHHEADRRAEMRERSRVASEAWELNSYPFTPHINPTSSQLASLGGGGSATKPLHERVGEVQARKEEKLSKLRQKVEAQEQATFKPNINPLSSAIAVQLQHDAADPWQAPPADGQLSATERLAAEAAASLERRAQVCQLPLAHSPP